MASISIKKWFVTTCIFAALLNPALSDAQVEMDANLLTAVDESASVGRHGEWLQYNGLARALTSPQFLAAVHKHGGHRRIGFVVVAWSSHGNVRVVLPWMAITTAADAFRAADLIERAPRTDRSSWDDEDETGASSVVDEVGSETDISATIDATTRMMIAAPFLADRRVINILANGRDNVGLGPQTETLRAVSLGLTINGLVFGNDHGLTDYFQRHVIGGEGSFVETVSSDPDTFNDTMVRKLLQDLFW